MYLKILSLLACGCLLVSCNNRPYNTPHILIETDIGDIEAELYPKQAPKTVAAFLKNVENGVYKNASFYRVLKNPDLDEAYNMGLIQGGIIKTNPALQQSLARIEHEPPAKTGLSHESGTLSMARTSAGTASSEFFICVGSQKQFDGAAVSSTNDGLGYAAFGRVVEGMQVVRKIQNRKSMGDAFESDVKIKNIKEL